MTLPLPPDAFMSSVGSSGSDHEALVDNYARTGAGLRALVDSCLPPHWSWDGIRYLDFGAGAGRVLRHFADVADVAEIHGCDVDGPMAAWAQANLCPPFAGVAHTSFDPPLPYETGTFDLVTAFSVFTHLGANWADWLLEIRRVLAPDGLFVVTFLDESCSMVLSDVPYDADQVGMSVLGYADPRMPYVNVLHSPWWLREHWGRAFEIERLVPGGTGQPDGSVIPGVQGFALMRPRAEALTADDLWLEAPGERRYAAAHRHQLDVFREEGERAKALIAEQTPPTVRARSRWRRRRSGS